MFATVVGKQKVVGGVFLLLKAEEWGSGGQDCFILCAALVSVTSQSRSFDASWGHSFYWKSTLLNSSLGVKWAQRTA